MKRERHEDWKQRWFKRYWEVRQMDLQEREGRDRWIEEIERFTDGSSVECICEHTYRTFAGPLSTWMWFCPQQTPSGMFGPMS